MISISRRDAARVLPPSQSRSMGEMTDLFLLESLDDGKSFRVLDVLHDQPIDSALILAINVGGLDKLRFQACDGVWLVVAIEMHGDSVDHCSLEIRGMRQIWSCVEIEEFKNEDERRLID